MKVPLRPAAAQALSPGHGHSVSNQRRDPVMLHLLLQSPSRRASERPGLGLEADESLSLRAGGHRVESLV